MPTTTTAKTAENAGRGGVWVLGWRSDAFRESAGRGGVWVGGRKHLGRGSLLPQEAYIHLGRRKVHGGGQLHRSQLFCDPKMKIKESNNIKIEIGNRQNGNSANDLFI